MPEKVIIPKDCLLNIHPTSNGGQVGIGKIPQGYLMEFKNEEGKVTQVAVRDEAMALLFTLYCQLKNKHSSNKSA